MALAVYLLVLILAAAVFALWFFSKPASITMMMPTKAPAATKRVTWAPTTVAPSDGDPSDSDILAQVDINDILAQVDSA